SVAEVHSPVWDVTTHAEQGQQTGGERGVAEELRSLGAEIGLGRALEPLGDQPGERLAIQPERPRLVCRLHHPAEELREPSVLDVKTAPVRAAIESVSEANRARDHRPDAAFDDRRLAFAIRA